MSGALLPFEQCPYCGDTVADLDLHFSKAFIPKESGDTLMLDLTAVRLTASVSIKQLREVIKHWRDFADEQEHEANNLEIQFAAVYRGSIISKRACADELSALCDLVEEP